MFNLLSHICLANWTFPCDLSWPFWLRTFTRHVCSGFFVLFHLCPLGGYRWMITPDMIQQTTGVWYIEARLNHSTTVPGLKLRISSFMTKCLYWNERNKTWSTAGCQAGVCWDREVVAFLVCSSRFVLSVCLLWPQVGVKSTPERAQCLCNHLTLFGSSFFVMPNHVDISRTAELFATVSDNFVVLALLCAFFGLYLITLLWACYADRRSSSKVRFCMSIVNAMLGEGQKKIGSPLKSTGCLLNRLD